MFLLVHFSILSLLHFCAQMTSRAVMISRITASGCGMSGVLAFVLFFLINFAEVTARVSVFLT